MTDAQMIPDDMKVYRCKCGAMTQRPQLPNDECSFCGDTYQFIGHGQTAFAEATRMPVVRGRPSVGGER